MNMLKMLSRLSVVISLVYSQLLIPNCPSITTIDNYRDNAENGRLSNVPSCFCDAAEDYGGDSSSIVINCGYGTTLDQLAHSIKQVQESNFLVFAISIDGLRSTELPANFFANLEVNFTRMSIKNCIDENSDIPLRIDDNFFAGVDKSLHSLLIYNCRLYTTPVAVKKLRNLQQLRLQNVFISTIRKGDLDGIEGLTTLDLQGNSLNVIEQDSLSNLQKLTNLILADNNLTESVFSVIKSLNSLLTFDVTKNSIVDIRPEDFSSLSSLDSLILRQNRLLSIPTEAFRSLTQLFELDLSENLLDTLEPNCFTSLRALRKLSLSDNFLTENSVRNLDLPLLQMLNLSKNNIENIPRQHFSVLSYLLILDLSKNAKLSNIAIGAFDGLRFLIDLDLSFTNISTLSGETLASTPSLSDLRLDGTQISTLSEDVFWNLTNLKFLHMESTKLSTVPENIFEYNKLLTSLDISDNKWHCDKNLAHLVYWLQNRENNAQTADEFRLEQIPLCWTPETLRGLPLRAVNANEL